MSVRLFVAAMLLALAANASAAESRTWTDKTGKFKIDATLQEVDDSGVVLKKADGTIIKVPFSKLSDADRKFAEATKKKPAEEKKPTEELSKQQLADLTISAKVSKDPPTNAIYYSKEYAEPPLFVTLLIKGTAIGNGIQYGKFKFDSIKDDRGNRYELLHPVDGPLGKKLNTEMVEMKHQFVLRRDEYDATLILKMPPADAKELSIQGSFDLVVGDSVEIEKLPSKMNTTLNHPKLKKVGAFKITEPTAQESSLTEAQGNQGVAIDFVGKPNAIHEIALVGSDGRKLGLLAIEQPLKNGARVVRWAKGEIPQDAKLRIVFPTAKQAVKVPIKLEKLGLNAASDPGEDAPPAAGDEKPAPVKAYPNAAWRRDFNELLKTIKVAEPGDGDNAKIDWGEAAELGAWLEIGKLQMQAYFKAIEDRNPAKIKAVEKLSKQVEAAHKAIERVEWTGKVKHIGRYDPERPKGSERSVTFDFPRPPKELHFSFNVDEKDEVNWRDVVPGDTVRFKCRFVARTGSGNHIWVYMTLVSKTNQGSPETPK